MSAVRFTAFLLVSAVFLAACGDRPDDAVLDPAAAPQAEQAPPAQTYRSEADYLDVHPDVDAVAQIRAVADEPVEGWVAFRELDSGQTEVHVSLTGLPANTRRGFHVHEFGSCEPGDDGEPAGAAGGHFNPQGHPHGGPDDPAGERHAGDFGNVTSDGDGRVDTRFTDPMITLSGQTSVVGLAVLIHAEEDDLATQPTGDAGGRVGCGIVQMR